MVLNMRWWVDKVYEGSILLGYDMILLLKGCVDVEVSTRQTVIRGTQCVERVC